MQILRSPRPAAVLLAALLFAAPAGAQQRTIVVSPDDLQSLALRLDAFALALPAPERALWEGLLRRASSASPTGGEVRVSPVLQIGPGGGCDSPGIDEAAGRVGIIVQGGRGATPAEGIIVQGGRGTRPAEGIIVEGGRNTRAPVQGGLVGGRPGAPAAEAPRPGGVGAVAMGPKQDDPSRPGGTCVLAIGPKQDDPGTPPQTLGRRIAVLATSLPEEERGALEWLLTRAAASPAAGAQAPGVPGRPGTPGGAQPMAALSLRQALGIDPLAIGPKQDDPAPPPPARGWTLRY